MEQFSLEKYLENPNRKIVTRDGNDARIICTDRVAVQPIIALVQTKDRESLYTYTTNGKYDVAETATDLDLFFAQKKEGWINLYKNSDNFLYVMCNVFSTKEEAKNCHRGSDYIATVKIQWEE